MSCLLRNNCDYGRCVLCADLHRTRRQISTENALLTASSLRRITSLSAYIQEVKFYANTAMTPDEAIDSPKGP